MSDKMCYMSFSLASEQHTLQKPVLLIFLITFSRILIKELCWDGSSRFAKCIRYNHEILLSKLQCMGFSGSTVKWFTSYLTGRTQVCDVEGATSDPEHITCGVPQGSILAPLLFL